MGGFTRLGINEVESDDSVSWGEKLMQRYFDLVYNPLYDLTVAQTSPYRRFQKTCIDKLQLDDNDAVLCIGVGTGNEILNILERNRSLCLKNVLFSV